MGDASIFWTDAARIHVNFLGVQGRALFTPPLTATLFQVRHEVSQYMPSALSTVRAIKYFGDKLANLGPDMSFIKYTMRSTTKGHTHSTIKRRPNESRDPMDRHNRSRCEGRRRFYQICFTV